MSILTETLIRNNRPAALQSLFSFFVTPTVNFPFESALWFLPVMFIVSLLYYCVDKITNKKLVVSIIIMILSGLGFTCGYVLSFRLPMGLDTALVSLLFYHVGHLFQKMNIIDQIINALSKLKIGYRLLVLIFCVSLATVFIFANQDFNMRKMQWGIIPLSILNAIISTMILIVVSKIFVDDHSIKDNIITKLTCFISEVSIMYVCVNHMTIDILYAVFSKLFSILSINTSWFLYLVVLVSSIILILVAGRIISKTRFRIILGK